MPSGEFKKFLDRDFAAGAVRPLTAITTPLLRELVDASLAAFRRCEVAAGERGEENVDVAPLILFRQAIEMVDGIEVLLAHSCGTAAIATLRSQFEACMSLAYMLQDDENYARRSLSWFVGHVHASIKQRETLEPGTESGQKYQAIYQKQYGRPIKNTPNAGIAAEIASRRKFLKEHPQFAPIEQEYAATKKGVKRAPDWFSLFGGPKNRRELAEQTRFGVEYSLLYGSWSGLGHANDLDRFLSRENGRPAHEALRRPTEVQLIGQLSALMLLRAYREMINKFRRGENTETWFKREVSPLLEQLTNLKITYTVTVEE